VEKKGSSPWPFERHHSPHVFSLDTTTAQGRLVFHIFGALAEFERNLIWERTQAGLAAARRIGRTGGRPPKLTDEDIEAAKALLANPDIGVTQIAHRLGVSPATLYRYIPAARPAEAGYRGSDLVPWSKGVNLTASIRFPECPL
jgi:DNA invertase Pin-like site-specific DNA recombinase